MNKLVASLALTLAAITSLPLKAAFAENIECGDDRPIILASPYKVDVERNNRTDGEVIDGTTKWLEERYSGFADCFEECSTPGDCHAYADLVHSGVTLYPHPGSDTVTVSYNAGTVTYGCTACGEQ